MFLLIDIDDASDSLDSTTRAVLVGFVNSLLDCSEGLNLVFVRRAGGPVSQNIWAELLNGIPLQKILGWHEFHSREITASQNLTINQAIKNKFLQDLGIKNIARLSTAITRSSSRPVSDSIFVHFLQESVELTHKNTYLTAQKIAGTLAQMDVPDDQEFEVRGQFTASLLELRASLESAGVTAETLSETQFVRLANFIEINEKLVSSFKRLNLAPETCSWLVEGPFHGSYSLSEINREFAAQLGHIGKNVSIHPVKRDPQPKSWLHETANSGLDIVISQNFQANYDVVTGNNYPPEVEAFNGRVNILHGYAWEESGFPSKFVSDFNSYLDGITVASNHTKKILIDNGVKLPILVTGIGLKDYKSEVIEPSSRNKVFTFLHVSSWFHRKGGDLLLEAFGQGFTKDQNVRLVIKTFPNPHNDVQGDVAKFKARFPNHAPVEVINEDMDEDSVAKLYDASDVVVMPSRAEGFGLPLAEALLRGKFVIATGWSGLTEISTSSRVTLIDFDFQKAKSHLNLFDSVWAEPRVSDLVISMKRHFELSSETQTLDSATETIRDLQSQFNWDKVTKKVISFAEHLNQVSFSTPPRIALMSTWNSKCGIAEYSRYLVGGDNSDFVILADKSSDVIYEDTDNVQRIWSKWDDRSLDKVIRTLVTSGIRVIGIQFHWGFFTAKGFHSFVQTLRSVGIASVVTLHSSQPNADYPLSDLALVVDALAMCDRVIVHGVDDLNNLKHSGIVHNATLLPHGINRPKTVYSRQGISSRSDEIQIGTFGFMFPHKGLEEMILAADELRRRGIPFKLNMLNSEYDSVESEKLARKCRALIKSLKLSKFVSLETSFLSDDEALAKLSRLDLIVYPYLSTNESASGAVRFGIGSGAEVAVAPLKIFNDVADVVTYLPGTRPQDIADGIEAIFNRKISADSKIGDQKEAWLSQHDFETVGYRYRNMLLSLDVNKSFEDSFKIDQP